MCVACHVDEIRIGRQTAILMLIAKVFLMCF